MGAEIDEADWPLVSVRWSGTITDQELEDFLARLSGWLHREQSFALLLDSRGALGATPPQFLRIVEAMRADAGATGRLLVQAVVIDSPVQRALYHAVTWAFAMPFPSKTFSEVEPARAWLLAQLRAREHRDAAAAAP